MNKYKKYILLLIPITIAVIWLMPKSCSHEEVKKSVNYLDTLEIKKKNDIIIHEVKEKGYLRIIDSLKNVKYRVVVKYIKSRDEVIKDTSKAVQIFISNCDSMEIVNAFMQQYKDTIIDKVQRQIAKIFGTHWHRMSQNGTYGSGLVNNWSLGCMGSPEPEFEKILPITRISCGMYGNKVTGTIIESKHIL